MKINIGTPGELAKQELSMRPEGKQRRIRAGQGSVGKQDKYFLIVDRGPKRLNKS